MKITIDKQEEEIKTKVNIDGEAEKEFDYVELIDALYDKQEIELEVLNFDDDVKLKIEKLFQDIKNEAQVILSPLDPESKTKV